MLERPEHLLRLRGRGRPPRGWDRQHEAAPTLFSGAGCRGGRGVPPEKCLRGPRGLFPDCTVPHLNGDQPPLASLPQIAKASNLEQLPTLHTRLEAGPWLLPRVMPPLPRCWPEEPGAICQPLGLPPPPLVARAGQLMWESPLPPPLSPGFRTAAPPQYECPAATVTNNHARSGLTQHTFSRSSGCGAEAALLLETSGGP